MIKLWCLAAMALVVSTLGASAQSKVPTALKSERPGEWLHQRHAEKVLEAEAGDVDLILIGDAIIHFWDRDGDWGASVWNQYYGHRHALNLGFGGDTTNWVNWRLQNGEIDGLNAKLRERLLAQGQVLELSSALIVIRPNACQSDRTLPRIYVFKYIV